MYHSYVKTCLKNCSFSIKDTINEHENNPDLKKDSNENREQAICELKLMLGSVELKQNIFKLPSQEIENFI